MSTYEILSIIAAFAVIAGGLIGMWVKLKTDLAKVQTALKDLETRLLENRREVQEKADYHYVKQSHQETNRRLDEIHKTLSMIVNKLMNNGKT